MPKNAQSIEVIAQLFSEDLQPVEVGEALVIFTDNRTGASYCECHVRGSKIVEFGTTDAPLDPAKQPEYRANREVLGNQPAFLKMQEDAKAGRSFSNIVAEYNRDFAPEKPLKIIGGQHRFAAVRSAANEKVDELHGIKVYFNLTKSQRIDVQLISNTNLAINGALVDRLKETFRGPALRDWCQAVGLLPQGSDFADKPSARGPIPAHIARSFIANYYLGQQLKSSAFAESETTPVLFKGGKDEAAWEDTLAENPDLWKDPALKAAGLRFMELVVSQREAFANTAGVPRDWKEKALNGAVLSGWAFIAGLLQDNDVRLQRHYKLASRGKEPLNAAVLSKGRHKTDPTSYRGLGARTDARERAQMAELFFILAEDDTSITKTKVDAAIYAWFAKRAKLEATAKRAD